MSTIKMLKQDSLGWYEITCDEDTGAVIYDPRAPITEPEKKVPPKMGGRRGSK